VSRASVSGFSMAAQQYSNPSLSFYAGTSGLVLPMPRYLFPPEFQEKSRLEYYASVFNSIEINSSFYKVPQAATVARWASSVPDTFTFTYKLWREITHVKELDFHRADVLNFMKVIEFAGERKGCLLVQFPPKLTIQHIGRLVHLLETIRAADPENKWKTAVEFRNASWYHKDVYTILKKLKMVVVKHDIRASFTPELPSDLSFAYYRFHGPEGNYRGSYTEDVLHEHAGYIKELIKKKKTVFVYFNNTAGDALKNLETLKNFIHLPERL
jgi:uncharacterized protein YecE (DUF72 family)